MSGIQQAVVSTFISTGLKPGDSYEGGYYVAEISTAGNGIADFRLVVAPKSTGQTAGLQWKTSNTDDPGANSIINGANNTVLTDTVNHPTAQFCAALSINGFTDWYMPARNELELCYFNLKPTTTSYATNSGYNINAVPPRFSQYGGNINNIPVQTSATIFIVGGSEAFDATYYWASNQVATTHAQQQTLYTGRQYPAQGQSGNVYGVYKTSTANTPRVRAVRKVAI
jgi:hypothetical protein